MTTSELFTEQSIVAMTVVLIAQCTLVTGLAMLLSRLRRGAAYRAATLRIGLYCSLLCPVATVGLTAFDIHWITFCVSDSILTQSSIENSSHTTAAPEEPNVPFPEVPRVVPAEMEIAPLPESTLPSQSQSPTVPIDDTMRLPFQESEPRSPTILTADQPYASEDVEQESQSGTNLVSKLVWSAIAVWVAGCLAGLLGVARSSMKLRRILRSARRVADDQLQSTIQQVETTLSAKGPLRVAESPYIVSPIAAGIFRPVIVLPEGLLGRLSSGEFRAVLLHEGAHVVRGDHLTLLLERLLVCTFWIHPFAHLLIRLLNRAREEVCDNYVLQSVDAASYSETLLRLMKLSTDGTRAGLAVGLFPTRWRLEERISEILNERRNTMVTTRTFTKVIVAVTLSLCALTIGTTTLTAQLDTSSDPDSEAPEVEASPNSSADEPGSERLIDIESIISGKSALKAPTDSAMSKPVPVFDDLERSTEPRPTKLSSGTESESDPSPVRSNHKVSSRETAGRVATVDLGRVFRTSLEFQRRIEALKQKISQSEEKQQEHVEELKALRKALEAISPDNADARTVLEKIIRDKETAFQQSKKEGQTVAMRQESQIYLDIYRKAHHAIRMYCEHYKIDLVLRVEGGKNASTRLFEAADPDQIKPGNFEDVLRQISRPVVYTSGLKREALDITDAIVDYLNKKYESEDHD